MYDWFFSVVNPFLRMTEGLGVCGFGFWGLNTSKFRVRELWALDHFGPQSDKGEDMVKGAQD